MTAIEYTITFYLFSLQLSRIKSKYMIYSKNFENEVFNNFDINFLKLYKFILRFKGGEGKLKK